MGKKGFQILGIKQYREVSPEKQIRWVLQLPWLIPEEFQAMMQGIQMELAFSLTWGGGTEYSGKPGWLNFIEQNTAEGRATWRIESCTEEELQRPAKTSSPVFSWDLVSTCMWRNYPRLRKESSKRNIRGMWIFRAHTYPGSFTFPTVRAEKPTWDVRTNAQRHIASIVRQN